MKSKNTKFNNNLKIYLLLFLSVGISLSAQLPPGYGPKPSTTAISFNGDFSNIGGTTEIAGVVKPNSPATTVGSTNPALQIKSQATFLPNGGYRTDAQTSNKYNTYSIMSGTKAAGFPFSGALLNSFPGDPANNVAAATNYLYSNGNVFPGQEYIIWEQTLSNLVAGRWYTFFMYVNNAIEPPTNTPDDPVVRLKLGGTSGLPNGTTVAGPTTLTEAATGSSQPLGGWIRVEHTFQATATTQIFKVTSAASGTWGDDFQMTQVNVVEYAPILNATSNAPVCLGSTLTLTASTPATGAMTYSWTGPDGFTSSLPNPTRPNMQSSFYGDYVVTITDAAGASRTETVTVLQPPAHDTDGDGINDYCDLDDDNDGILDTVENGACGVPDPTIPSGNGVIISNIFKEDFGTMSTATGTHSVNMSTLGTGATTTYNYYDAVVGTTPTNGLDGGASPFSLQDNRYTIFNQIRYTATWATSVWQSTLGDHTGGGTIGSGRMFVVNASNNPGEFYRRTLTNIVQGEPINASLWIMNIDTNITANSTRILPNITVKFMQGTTTLYSYNTGNIPREALGNPSAWKFFKNPAIFIPTSNANIDLVLVNNAPGGGGNDLAIDDIIVYQSFCDTDNDGIPNYLDLDSDNDGCADAIEGSETVTVSQIHSISLPSTDPNYAIRGQIKVIYNGTTVNTGANIISMSAASMGVPQLVNNAGNNLNATTNPSNLAGIADNTDTPTATADIGQGIGTSTDATTSACFIDAVDDINQVPLGVTATGSVLTNDESLSNPITVQSATYLNSAGVVTNLPLGTATNVYDAAGVLAGSMTLNSNGTYTFVPTSTYVGKVPVDYVAVNSVGITDPAQLTIVVIKNPITSANDNPIAQNDTGYTEVNTTVSSNVLVNDSDPDGNPLTVTGATGLTIGTATVVSGVNSAGVVVANAGTVTLNSNGTYTYIPATGFVGTVNPIPYTISDGQGGTATAILNLNVIPNFGNNTFGNDDANSGVQGTTLTGNVKTNDTDPEGNSTTITGATAGGTTITIGTATTIPGVGSLTLNANGTYTFVPLATYTGTTSVVYTVCDNQVPQACDTATLYLTELPTTYIDAVDDINQVPQGVTATGSVLTNDESLSNPITVQSATYLNSAGVVTNLPLGTATNVYDAAGVLAGSMTLNINGTYTFVPTSTYVGKVPVDYVAVNSVGITDPAQLTIVVIKNPITSANDNPIAQNDTGYTEVNTTVSSNVLVNDSDPDGNPLTVTGATGLTIGTATVVSGVNSAGVVVANAGTVTLNSNGTYTYIPATGFVGTVNPIPYTISDGQGGTATAILNLNVIPNFGNNTFGNDDANSGVQGTTLTGNVKTNDTDPEGNSTTITGATAGGTTITIGTATTIPGVGSLTLNANGTYTFVPLATYTGTTSVVYTVCDNQVPQACDTATLYLTELPTTYIDAVDDINQVPQGVTATGSVLTNDETATGFTPITVQSATYLNSAGVVTNLPLGTATNVYDAAGVLAGSMTLNANGSYTFVPTSTYVGKVPVNYIAVNSAGSTDPAQLTIVVIKTPAGTNNNPIAQNDTGYTELNTPVSSNVLVNDSDPDGNPLTVTGATGLTLGTATVVSGVNSAGVVVANAGTVTLNSNGTYTYTPATGFVGTVNPIPYTISDGLGGTATAVLNLTVLTDYGNNTFGNDDANTGIVGTTLTGNVKTNDTDPEGNSTTITGATAGGTTITIGTATTIPGVGSLTLNATGTYTFVPFATYTGTTSVVYTVCDSGVTPQACDTATLYLTLLPLGVCYDLPNTATAGVDTKHGITLLQRAGTDNGNWPMIRKSAHTALESNTKGFVITRVAGTTGITSPQEGMMVYDTVAKCLKLYDGTAWSCFNTPACP